MAIADTLQHNFLKLHQALYINSGGRLGHRMIGVPCLLLRSTGRRSGVERTNAIVYAKDGGDYVLIASNGGADVSPGWYFNVKHQPSCSVQVGTNRFPATARIVSKGDPDYDRLFQLADSKNHGRFGAYQTRTSRPIPVVVLSPA